MRLLTLDPGSITGWAFWEDGKLIAFGHIKREQFVTFDFPRADRVIIEMPRIYPGAKAEAPPNDLVVLALWAGFFGGVLEERWGVKAEYVFPRDWKGTLPKEITQKRALLTLSPEELLVIEGGRSKRTRKLNHNAMDAVGLGLWGLYRRYEVQTLREPVGEVAEHDEDQGSGKAR